jgi:hypothetical protein
MTGDPTGAYFRYAFSTGVNFPDYPKYGVWPNAYFLSTREFAPDDSFAGDGAYALERGRMLRGDPRARAVQFLLTPGSKPYLPGDGLLPADLDGTTLPPDGSPNYFVGTMDDGAGRGAPFDGINVFRFSVTFGGHPTGSFALDAQLPVAQFDSIFPCHPTSRSCIPQPKTGNTIDILSYRQRPTFRLAYRNFGIYESLVTNQSVEARPGIAGVRWYEIRRTGGAFSVFQQGTHAPVWPVTRRRDDLERRRSHHRGRIPEGQLPMGRLHGYDGGPDRRLHLLVRRRVLRAILSARVADEDRELPAARVLTAIA